MNADAKNFQELNKTKFEQRGTVFNFGIPITNAVSIGNSIAVGFGDGSVRIFNSEQSSEPIKAHKSIVLCMSKDGNNILTGGDDGRFLKISLNGEVKEIGNFGSRWVDNVTASNGSLVCSSGKVVYLWAPDKKVPKLFEHDSTIGGVAFDKKGRRMAVSRYGGVTLWKKDYSNKWKSSDLIWKGSHNKVIFSPDGKYLVTSMQENRLHFWRLKDKYAAGMSGYVTKVKSFAFAHDSKYLATSGAEYTVCWPFDGDGPEGREPICFPYLGKKLVKLVEPFPYENAIFTGFSDGSVFLSQIENLDNTIIIRSSTSSEVSAIAVTSDRSNLLIGDMGGNILWTSIWGDEENN